MNRRKIFFLFLLNNYIKIGLKYGMSSVPLMSVTPKFYWMPYTCVFNIDWQRYWHIDWCLIIFLHQHLKISQRLNSISKDLSAFCTYLLIRWQSPDSLRAILIYRDVTLLRINTRCWNTSMLLFTIIWRIIMLLHKWCIYCHNQP